MTSSVNSNAVLCVKGEIHNVLTVLRLNSRWASRERFTREVPLRAESPLAQAFKNLHSHLEEVDDLANVDTVRYLVPFLAVVESPATTGPMTGVALSSLHKFLLYGFIRKDCPRVKEAITLIAQAISRCHFEETDPESDEVVLMKLLELSALCLRCEVGDLLEDESCWSLFLACYNLYHVTTDDRASGLLRDTAGNTLAHVVLMLFNCLRVARHVAAAAAAAAADPKTVSVKSSTFGGGDGGSDDEQNGRWSNSNTLSLDDSGNDKNSLVVESAIDRTHETPDLTGRTLSPMKQVERAAASARSSPTFWRGVGAKREVGDTDHTGGDGGAAAAQAASTAHSGGHAATQTVSSLPEAGTEEEPWPSVDDDGAAGGEESVQLLGESRAVLEAVSGSRGGLGDTKSCSNGSDGSVSRESREGQGASGWYAERGESGVAAKGGGAEEVEGVLVNVMRFLSRLSDPRSNKGAECVLGLSLINIALEAGGADLGRIPALVTVMRGDLCKHLLQNSQTEDLDVLSLTLRVVFNLFNSIKDHLKVQLEVFLTSVHLRVLDGASNGPEQQELALESLLEFTREPALMLDVYINYDCDVQCTNLFETICHSLSSHALPRDGMEVNALNRLALEGVLAVIESISRRCQASPLATSRAVLQLDPPTCVPRRGSHVPSLPSPGADSRRKSLGASTDMPAFFSAATNAGGRHANETVDDPGTSPLSATPQRSGGGGIDALEPLAVPDMSVEQRRRQQDKGSFYTSASDSDSDQDSVGSFPYAYGHASSSSSSVLGGGPAFGGDGGGAEGSHGWAGSEDDAFRAGGWLERARARTAEVLQERKKMKRRLGLAAERFNSGSKGWLEYAQELALIPTPATPAATAMFLRRTVMLDKSMLGEYLSRGPPDKYPFHAKVLEEYVKLFDMREKTFVEALRAFLKEFRLPGEAQCIDRLMEAFAGQQYLQGLGAGRHPFVSADAAFTMAFSAIMLNTDLHNPQIQDSRRMSLDDFVRNNRQINGGNDLPREFLEGVYNSIKDLEIQVHRDHVSMAADGLGIDYTQHWDGILNRSNSVASASFTPSQAARKHLFPAGVHERDMLLSITGPASDAMRAVFLRTKDDLLVLGCLRGFRSHARACVYLGLVPPFDSALHFFFRRGVEYASAAAEGAVGLPLPEVLKNPGLPEVTDMAACAPFASGCVVHRDLLALKCGLELARAYAHCVSSAWEPLLECVFALADLQALPPSLTDVDDFGDAQGNPLPPSVFARRCRDRARSGQNALLSQAGGTRAAAAGGSGGGGGGGLWGSLSGVLFSRAGEGGLSGGRRGGAAAEASIGALAEVVRTVQLEQLFSQTKDLPLEVVERLLSALLSSRDPAAVRRSVPPSTVGSGLNRSISGDRGEGGGSGRTSAGSGTGSGGTDADLAPFSWAAAASFEAHAVLALELSSRVVLANRHRVNRLWPTMHGFLARVLGGQGSVTMTRMPFLVERAMVTVLRACIHMLDRQDMGALLLESLKLLLALPSNVVLPLSNRLASGLLILIQANASALSAASTVSQWEVIGLLMAKAVVGDGGRGFVLEALAFVVKRGLGLLGRHNVFMAHALLSSFAQGNFGDGKPDFAWALQACSALEGITFTIFEALLIDDGPNTEPLRNHNDQNSSNSNKDSDQSLLFNMTSSPSKEADRSAVSTGNVGTSASATTSGIEVVDVMDAALDRGAVVQDGLSRDEAERLWLSSLRVMAWLAASAFPRVAKGAAESLERLVLQLHGARPAAWGEAFTDVLLQLPVPLLPTDYRPKPGEAAARGTWNEEVCLRCCTILSHAFLHHLQALSSLPVFGKLWLESIRLLSQNLDTVRHPSDASDQEGGGEDSSGRKSKRRAGGGVAAESCQQIVTNMVMVVAHMGLLGGPALIGDTGPGDASGGEGVGRGRDQNVSQEAGRLLYLTRQILEPVCPGLRPLLRGLAGDDLATPSPVETRPSSEPPTPARDLSSQEVGGNQDIMVDNKAVEQDLDKSASDDAVPSNDGTSETEMVSIEAVVDGFVKPLDDNSNNPEYPKAAAAEKEERFSDVKGSSDVHSRDFSVSVSGGGQLPPGAEAGVGAVGLTGRNLGVDGLGANASSAAEVFDRPRSTAAQASQKRVVSGSRRLGTAQIV